MLYHARKRSIAVLKDANPDSFRFAHTKKKESAMNIAFNAVIPLLPVADVAHTVAYYRDTLGYQVSQSGDGWGSALRGKANFYFTKADTPHALATCFVYVDEVDALCATFRAAGAAITEDVADKPWGFRQFTLADLNGHHFHYFRFADGLG